MPKSSRKLKRFLLRYDPPGIGLEVLKEDEEVEVFHENLPESLSNKKEVEKAVDELIQMHEADGLLSAKRHKSALMKTVGRLYRIDVDNVDEAESGGRASGDEEASASAFQVGVKVVLGRLEGDKQQYCGEIGRIVKAKPDKQKYEVEMRDGEVIKVKGDERLMLVTSTGTLSVGNLVAIRGLKNHTELNGCIAKVVESYEEAARYEVRSIESNQLFRVKKDNLVAIEVTAAIESAIQEARGGGEEAASAATKSGLPAAVGEGQTGGGDPDTFEIGSTVELTGLKTAQAYNGQVAEVLSVDRVRSRYEIRLGDGSVKTIRAENVRLVQGKTPRSKRKEKNA